MSHKRKFWVFVLLQMLFLLGMAGFKYYTVVYGTKIMLKTVPVDPRDLFRGDYVVLNYDISEINLLVVKHDLPEHISRSQSVYVKLYKSGQYWYPNFVSLQKPLLASGEVNIKGKFLYRNSFPMRRVNEGPNQPYDGLTLEYGIESYYVPEGQGHSVEREVGNIEAQVSVDKFGNAALANLFLGGKEIKFE